MATIRTSQSFLLDLADVGASGHGRRERDFDEVIFSSPFRRLAGKAQIFPMVHDDSAHNRLVHSLECASVGRSLGRDAAQHLDLPEGVCPGDVAATVATAALTHDIGNPPFGHAGESAIQAAFAEDVSWYRDLRIDERTLADLRNIDGNSIGLHMLLRDFSLTATTILAATKRPWLVGVEEKHCVLSVDVTSFSAVAEKAGIESTGRTRWQRHPLSYLMEAADDICYLVMDAIDAVDLGIIQEKSCREHLEPLVDAKGLELTRLRDKALSTLVKRAGEEFHSNLDAIREGSFDTTLRKSLDEKLGGSLGDLKDFERREIYNHRPVVEMEVAGFEIIQLLLESFGRAAVSAEPSEKEQKLHALMPARIKERLGTEESAGRRMMEAVCYVAGMTDRYAYESCQTLRGGRLPRMLP